MSFKIYTLDYSRARWNQICIANYFITLEKMPTPSLQALNLKICGSIIDWESTENSPNQEDKKRIVVGNSDKLEFLPLGDLRWRRGTIYYGVQYSYKTKKLRITIYGTDKVHHGAVSFGTNPIDLPISEIYDKIQKELSQLDFDKLDISSEIKELLKSGNYTIGI